MELLEAVKKVLEWYAEDSSDNVARRAVMYDLQEAYDNASQHRVQADNYWRCAKCQEYNPSNQGFCSGCGETRRR